MTTVQEHEDGFDEAPDVEQDDRVVLHTREGDVPCVLLAVFAHDGRDFALLTPVDEVADDDGELLVCGYAEDEAGVPSFLPVDDDVDWDAVQRALGELIPMDAEGPED